MRLRNGLPYAAVAAVAVGAVIAGAAIAAQRGPEPRDTDAAPLPGTSVSTTAAPTPTPTTPPPSRNPAGQTVKIDLAKLPTGRAPQHPYVEGRTLKGGAGGDITIPGSGEIFAAARHNGMALVLVNVEHRTQLLEVDGLNTLARIDDMSSLAVSSDATQAAAAGNPRTDSGADVKGGSVYFLGAGAKPVRLSRPNDYELRVLAVIDGVVYFRSLASSNASSWNLYSWKPGSGVETIDAVRSPTAIAPNGSMAGSMISMADFGTCTAVVALDTGGHNWRTCDYRLMGFTPNAGTAYGSDSYGDGYGDSYLVALDAKTGNLQTKWTGTSKGFSILDAEAEDDQHLLIEVDSGPESPRGIIRCTIATGACEIAVEPTTKGVVLGV